MNGSVKAGICPIHQSVRNQQNYLNQSLKKDGNLFKARRKFTFNIQRGRYWLTDDVSNIQYPCYWSDDDITIQNVSSSSLPKLIFCFAHFTPHFLVLVILTLRLFFQSFCCLPEVVWTHVCSRIFFSCALISSHLHSVLILLFLHQSSYYLIHLVLYILSVFHNLFDYSVIQLQLALVRFIIILIIMLEIMRIGHRRKNLLI